MDEKTLNKSGRSRHYNMGEKNPFWGKCHTEETRELISKAQAGKRHPHTGRPLSEEAKRLIGQAQLGRHHTKETCQKMSASHTGRPLSEETIEQMAKAKLGKGEGSEGPFRREARSVAELMLGRPLTKAERVHHINVDPTNNDEDNLHIYPSESEHKREHVTLRGETSGRTFDR